MKDFLFELLFRLPLRFMYISPSHVVASARRLSVHIVNIFSFSIFFISLYSYISVKEGCISVHGSVAATTRWRRAFNLELMNESSHDWTAMS